jgi:hypothetical protein
MNKDKSQMILIRISKAFKQQQQQADLTRKAMQYPTVIKNRGISIPTRNITLKDFEEVGAT